MQNLWELLSNKTFHKNKINAFFENCTCERKKQWYNVKKMYYTQKPFYQGGLEGGYLEKINVE